MCLTRAVRVTRAWPRPCDNDACPPSRSPGSPSAYNVESEIDALRAHKRKRLRSRKVENHMAAVAINYFAYNLIKIHSTVRTSPAMAAGVTYRLFDVSDLVNLLIESEREKAAKLLESGPMSEMSRFGLALLLPLSSAYVLLSARPQIGNVFQRWDLTPRQSRVIGISGLVVASGLFISALL